MEQFLNLQEEVSYIQQISEKIKSNISKVFVGKEEIIELIITALFSGGHVLLEDLPGMGKTLLAKLLAKSVGCYFKRIQFTPDLLPSDILGIKFYDQKEGEFVLREGPVFSNIVLGDEINRATPRTQSSMLECMEEKQVTIDGETRLLPRPFFVIATQNPIETHGTFPLPEAQMDRFLMRLKIGYLAREEEKAILDRFENDNPLQNVQHVITSDEVVKINELFSRVKVHDDIKFYIVDMINMTRTHEKVIIGASPRAGLALMKASQAYAAIKGRIYVTPEDIKHLAVPVLAHRLTLKGNVLNEDGLSAQAVISDILKKVKVPTEEIYEV